MTKKIVFEIESAQLSQLVEMKFPRLGLNIMDFYFHSLKNQS